MEKPLAPADTGAVDCTPPSPAPAWLEYDLRETVARLSGETELQPGSEGYPPDLVTLVEGVPIQNDQSGAKLKFLRRIPTDPMTNSTEWGLRAYQDRPGALSWGRGNVFDVYSKSGGTALDGTKYKDW